MRTAEVTVWNQGIFSLAGYNLESLLSALDEFDFGIFVLSSDDALELRHENVRVPRDNVIFELGLFVGRLGRHRSFIVVPDTRADFRVATDLLGVNFAEYEVSRSDGNAQAATGPACTRIRESLEKVGIRSATDLNRTVGQIQEEPSSPEDVSPAGIEQSATNARDKTFSWFGLYLEGKNEEAISQLSKIISESTELQDSKSPFTLASLRAWSGRIRYSIDAVAGTLELEELISQNPSDSNAYMQLGYAHQLAGRYPQSLAVLDQGIQLSEEKENLVIAKARTLVNSGEEATALNTLADGILLHPDSPLLHLELTDLLVRVGDIEGAKLVLEKSCADLPFNEAVQSKYAAFLYEHGDKGQSLLVYDSLLENHDKNTSYLTYRANIFLDFELFGLALRDYERANEMTAGKESWILANIGNVFKNRGFYEKAADYLKQALVLDPSSKYAHERLAMAMEQQEAEAVKADAIRRQARLGRKNTNNEDQQ